MLYSFDLRSLIKCSAQEKRALFPLAQHLIDLAEKARREGLLSLEDGLSEEEPSLRLGLTLVVDGTDPGIVRKILHTRIVVGAKEGAALLRELIVMEGVLAIQSGDNPRIVEEHLAAFLLPEDFEDPDAKSGLDEEEKARRAVEKRLAEQGEHGPLSGNTALIENLTLYDDRAIQRVLREVDNQELAKAMKGASSDVARLVLRNMSARAALVLHEDLTYMGPVREIDVSDCQQKISNILKRLEDAGEIVRGTGPTV